MRKRGLTLFIHSWDFFCLETNEQNDTVPMEDMGHDACVIVGYHKNVSIFTQFHADTNILTINTIVENYTNH